MKIYIDTLNQIFEIKMIYLEINQTIFKYIIDNNLKKIKIVDASSHN